MEQECDDYIVELKSLKRSYQGGDTVEVLKGIDLKVKAGETVGILGASGAGKSTLLNIIGALDRATSGDVLFRGENLSNFDDNRLAAFRNEHVGFVFQFHHLLPEFTALENVMLPALIGGTPFDEAREKALVLLGEVGLSKRVTHKPGELSGGEQQRTAIVRALIQEPALLLADEPTGNLDAKTGHDVFEIILDLNKRKGLTIGLVTHNRELAGMLSRRLVMSDGLLHEEEEGAA